MIRSLIKLPKLFTISTPRFFHNHYAHVEEVICKQVHFFVYNIQTIYGPDWLKVVRKLNIYFYRIN